MSVVEKVDINTVLQLPPASFGAHRQSQIEAQDGREKELVGSESAREPQLRSKEIEPGETPRNMLRLTMIRSRSGTLGITIHIVSQSWGNKRDANPPSSHFRPPLIMVFERASATVASDLKWLKVA